MANVTVIVSAGRNYGQNHASYGHPLPLHEWRALADVVSSVATEYSPRGAAPYFRGEGFAGNGYAATAEETVTAVFPCAVEDLADLRKVLGSIASEFHQDCIALTVVDPSATEFIGPRADDWQAAVTLRAAD